MSKEADRLNLNSNQLVHTFAMHVAYNGELFRGFARQSDQSTIQGDIERALELLFKREIQTTCAGRTDAGVHAIGQVVSFDLLDDDLLKQDSNSILRALNALTCDEIYIKNVLEKPSGFSARFDAKTREYRYFIANELCKPMFMSGFSWHIKDKLDIDAMSEACGVLVGEHDFKSFCVAASAVGKPTCRNIVDLNFKRVDVLGEELIQMSIVGSSFLHSMVRTIVGSAVEIGQCRRPVQWMKQVLDAKDRQAAGMCAPAKGLVLWKVEY